MTENDRKENDTATNIIQDLIKSWGKCKSELEQYHEIGTIEEFKALKDKHIGKDNMVISSSDLMTILNSDSEELKQYKEVGTVEECRVAVERMKPYKPKEYEDKYYSCKCGNTLMMKYKKYPTELMSKRFGLDFCLSCGQKIDWSE